MVLFCDYNNFKIPCKTSMHRAKQLVFNTDMVHQLPMSWDSNVCNPESKQWYQYHTLRFLKRARKSQNQHTAE